MQENCTGKGNLTWNNTLRGNKRKRPRGTGREDRDVPGTLTAVLVWHRKSMCPIPVGSTQGLAVGATVLGTTQLREPHTGGGKGKVRISMSVPASMA